jgi:hypothetical protein
MLPSICEICIPVNKQTSRRLMASFFDRRGQRYAIVFFVAPPACSGRSDLTRRYSWRFPIPDDAPEADVAR